MVGFLPLLIEEVRTQGARKAVHRFAHVVYVLLPGLVFGYLLMGLVWPWSIMKPGNPLQALTYFSHFFEKPWKEMFDGALVSVPDMPWSYLPTLFACRRSVGRRAPRQAAWGAVKLCVRRGAGERSHGAVVALHVDVLPNDERRAGDALARPHARARGTAVVGGEPMHIAFVVADDERVRVTRRRSDVAQPQRFLAPIACRLAIERNDGIEIVVT